MATPILLSLVLSGIAILAGLYLVRRPLSTATAKRFNFIVTLLLVALAGVLLWFHFQKPASSAGNVLLSQQDQKHHIVSWHLDWLSLTLPARQHLEVPPTLGYLPDQLGVEFRVSVRLEFLNTLLILLLLLVYLAWCVNNFEASRCGMCLLQIGIASHALVADQLLQVIGCLALLLGTGLLQFHRLSFCGLARVLGIFCFLATAGILWVHTGTLSLSTEEEVVLDAKGQPKMEDGKPVTRIRQLGFERALHTPAVDTHDEAFPQRDQIMKVEKVFSKSGKPKLAVEPTGAWVVIWDQESLNSHIDKPDTRNDPRGRLDAYSPGNEGGHGKGMRTMPYGLLTAAGMFVVVGVMLLAISVKEVSGTYGWLNQFALSLVSIWLATKLLPIFTNSAQLLGAEVIAYFLTIVALVGFLRNSSVNGLRSFALFISGITLLSFITGSTVAGWNYFIPAWLLLFAVITLSCKASWVSMPLLLLLVTLPFLLSLYTPDNPFQYLLCFAREKGSWTTLFFVSLVNIFLFSLLLFRTTNRSESTSFVKGTCFVLLATGWLVVSSIFSPNLETTTPGTWQADRTNLANITMQQVHGNYFSGSEMTLRPARFTLLLGLLPCLGLLGLLGRRKEAITHESSSSGWVEMSLGSLSSWMNQLDILLAKLCSLPAALYSATTNSISFTQQWPGETSSLRWLLQLVWLLLLVGLVVFIAVSPFILPSG